MYVVVSYDISDHRRRARLHELLLGYGQPVQRSVFECRLTHQQVLRLQAQARRLVRGARDSIRYYQMCRQCQQRTRSDGTLLVEAETPGDFMV